MIYPKITLDNHNKRYYNINQNKCLEKIFSKFCSLGNFRVYNVYTKRERMNSEMPRAPNRPKKNASIPDLRPKMNGYRCTLDEKEMISSLVAKKRSPLSRAYYIKQ